MNSFFNQIGGHRIIRVTLLVIFSVAVYTVNAAPINNTSQAPLAPSVNNGSFETGSTGNGLSSLSGWTISSGTVDLLAGSAAANGSASDGSKFLDLANATIEQTIGGFTANQPYVLRIDYQGNTNDDDLKDAKVIINGQEKTQGLFGGDLPGIHSKEESDWVVCNGFEFTPTTTTVTIKIDSEEAGSDGLFIDNIRILDGGIAQPPEHDFNSLPVDSDGWRPLVNGSFEATIATHTSDPENTGPDDDNPHLCGDALPGWRVTRENTDQISGSAWNVPDGDHVMDVGGHGPGSIAQTITGLTANSDYKLEFMAARHRFWETNTMTTEVWANGQLEHAFSRTSSQTANTGYIREEVTLTSDSSGKITFEIFSTNVDKGGNNVMDDFRMIQVSGPTATHTAVPTETPPPTATATNTPIPTATSTLPPTPTQTATPISSPTASPTQTAVPTATTPATLTPTPTSIPTSTSTPDGTGSVELTIHLPNVMNLAGIP
ncbi:MAG: DUF642 domain-containing protein [Anaerolineae bacterium]